MYFLSGIVSLVNGGERNISARDDLLQILPKIAEKSSLQIEESTEAIKTVITQYGNSLEFSSFRNQVGAVVSSLKVTPTQEQFIGRSNSANNLQGVTSKISPKSGEKSSVEPESTKRAVLTYYSFSLSPSTLPHKELRTERLISEKAK